MNGSPSLSLVVLIDTEGFEFIASGPPAGRKGRNPRWETGPAVWPAVALRSHSCVALSSTALPKSLRETAVGCKAINSLWL